MKRKIIKIDEDKCNGCGLCIPNCPEGALQIIDGKARLVSDLFCDGLGACIGECPEGAIKIEEREAQKYDEAKVMENVVKQGKNTIIAHLKHLKDHNQIDYYKQAIDYMIVKNFDLPSEIMMDKKLKNIDPSCKTPELVSADEKETKIKVPCLGSQTVTLKGNSEENEEPVISEESQLRQWPIQINLVPPNASFLDNSDILVAADCVAFSYPGFNRDLLKGRILLIGCPKFDDSANYYEKMLEIFKTKNIKSVTVAHMEVPCCFSMTNLVKKAIEDSGKAIPFKDVNISIKGNRI